MKKLKRLWCRIFGHKYQLDIESTSIHSIYCTRCEELVIHRDKIKSARYGYLYGMGDKRISEIINSDEETT